MPTPTPNHRWYHFTPTRFFLGFLVVQVFLLLSERFRWFAFNEHKGWTVLIALGIVCAAVLVMVIWGLVCVCLRRRFQFSFRSLLFFLVALSVPLGWFAWEVQRARRQREAVEAIVGMGENVSYDFERAYLVDGQELTTPAWLLKLFGGDFFYEVVGVTCYSSGFRDKDVTHLQKLTNLKQLHLDNTRVSDDGLAHLKKRSKLERLSLEGTQITDRGLAHLGAMAKLEGLFLGHTRITDDGLAYLEGMVHLKILFLCDTHITDIGLAHLEKMTQLESLSLVKTQVSDTGLKHLSSLRNLNSLALRDTQITDAGLEHLTGLTNLEHLDLRSTQVTDAGLKCLTGLTDLRWLRLKDTQVTHEGVRKLQEALPNELRDSILAPTPILP